ncbi:MAG: 30S ribosomal protein S20 [Candidatus Andersenbacteria bacterium]|nr:30S ribosomal protein S20 [Candidatus Andersenbacteria bacterium]MBI3251135.1 30S ribosomal protein S20 [Candidatus Andersenbacteria bacterium]
MPQLDQAKKALRQDKHRRMYNDRWRKNLRAGMKALRVASTAGDKKEAEKSFIAVSSLLDAAARRHIIHPNKAARKKSRLAKALAKIAK